MAKYYGAIGFETTEETSPGIWEESIVEKYYYGDLIKNYRKLESGASVNDDVVLNNQISIVSDAYADRNFLSIRYATFMGIKCKVTSVDVERPRLILTLGNEYNNGNNRSEYE